MKQLFALFGICIAAGIAVSFAVATGSVSVRQLPLIEAVPLVHTTAHLIFTGDVMLARDVERKSVAYGASYPYTHVTDLLTGDAVIGNFEASVPEIHEPTPSMVMRFSVPPHELAALRDAGFTHVSLANNHADDYGESGYANTVHSLIAAGLVPFGKPYALATSSVSYLDTPAGVVALIGVYAVDVLPSGEEIAAVTRMASAESDVQIAYVHWGEEYALTHNAAQEWLAHALIDHGVDMVIGHHPHVVEDVALYNGKLIVYSLGNFIFDQYFSADVKAGLVLSVAYDGASLTTTLIPVSTEDSPAAPYVLTGAAREAARNALAERSDPALKRALEAGELTVPLQ
jgi:poly-gamma-glutamate synthesis protein (capsule biosynthesis protein)